MNPVATFKKKRKQASWLKALLGFMVPSLFAGLVAAVIVFFVLSVVAAGLHALATLPFGSVTVPSASASAFAAIAGAVMFAIPILAVVAALVFNLFVYVACRVLGGKGTFKQQFYLASIAFAASWLVLIVLLFVTAILPFSALAIYPLWLIYAFALWFLAVKEAHWP